MTIVKDKSGITIRLQGKPDVNKIQSYLDLMRHEEIVSKSKATNSSIDSLAKELNGNWWKKNKSRFGI
jgi:hypothetical protein